MMPRHQRTRVRYRRMSYVLAYHNPNVRTFWRTRGWLSMSRRTPPISWWTALVLFKHDERTGR